MKKIMLFCSVLALLVCAVLAYGVFASADAEVVYLDAKSGSDANDGGSDTNALKTLDAAYKKVGDTGVIVFVSDYQMTSEYVEPSHGGQITLTSKYGGKDYGAKLKNAQAAVFKLNGSTVFADITLETSKEISFVAQFNPIVFDYGFETKYTGSETNKGTNVRVMGGFYAPTVEQTAILDRDAHITINSGDFYLVVGSTKDRGKGQMVHTGTVYMTVNGGSVDILYGGTHANHAAQDLVFNMNGGYVKKFSTAGDVSRRLYGSAEVNLNGGVMDQLIVNNVMGDATVNINGMAPGSATVSYYNDTLRKDAEKKASVKTVNYNALICSKGLIDQFNTYFHEVNNMTCLYVSDGGTGDGTSRDKAMGSLSAAYAMLSTDGGKIIVSGSIHSDMSAETLTEYKGIITVVGESEGSKLILASGSKNYFESDTVFESITIVAEGEAALYGCYNALSVKNTVKTQGTINVVGSGINAQADDIKLVLDGGSFESVCAIGADANASASIKAYINLGGAAVKNATLSKNAAVASYGSLSLSGGRVENVNVCEAGGFDTVSVKVLGAEIGKLKLTGAVSKLFFNVSKAEFDSNIEAGTLPAKENNVLILGSDVDESKLSAVRASFGVEKSGNILYVADNGTGLGISPESPMGSIADAIVALGGEGSVVIVGTYTIDEALTIAEHSYPVVITSIGADEDFRDSGACIIMNENIYLGGETTFEKVNFIAPASSLYIYGMAKKLTVGSEVNTTLKNSNTAYINIVGGRNDTKLSTGIDLTINSGDWGIVRGGTNNTTVYGNDVTIDITVNGGIIHRYFVAASRGKVNGTIKCTINGGVFYQGVFAVYEEDGKAHKPDYEVDLIINGGEFYQMIGPAKTRDTELYGTYNLYLNGGDFSSVADVIGTELYAGSMSSYITIADSVDINKQEVGTETFTNPVRSNGPDPWVFYHNGFYYYTHTTGSKIILMKVANISDIDTSAETAIITPTKGQNMWSPEIHYFPASEVGEQNAGWYLFFGFDDGTTANQRAHVLKCKNGDDFFGEWVNPVTGVVNDPEKIVFPDFPELDSLGGNGGYSKITINGKAYMTFIRDEGRGTPDFHQMICIAEIETPWRYIGKPVTIAVPEYEWEMHGYGQDSATGGWYPKVIEGASAVYGDNGEVYLVYTGSGYWTIYYQLGFIKFMGGDPLDPNNWKKNPTPILALSDEVNGCGHGSYFRDHDGNYWVAYHGYLGKDTSSGRYIHIERIYVTPERVYIGNDSGHPAPLSTIQTITTNPQPLKNKISGFVEKTENRYIPNVNKGDKNGEETDQIITTPQTENNNDTTAIIIAVSVCAVIVIAAVIVVLGSGKKKAKSAAATAEAKEDSVDKTEE